MIVELMVVVVMIMVVGRRMVMVMVVVGLSVKLTCVEGLVRMWSWIRLWGRARFA